MDRTLSSCPSPERSWTLPSARPPTRDDRRSQTVGPPTEPDKEKYDEAQQEREQSKADSERVEFGRTEIRVPIDGERVDVPLDEGVVQR